VVKTGANPAILRFFHYISSRQVVSRKQVYCRGRNHLYNIRRDTDPFNKSKVFFCGNDLFSGGKGFRNSLLRFGICLPGFRYCFLMFRYCLLRFRICFEAFRNGLETVRNSGKAFRTGIQTFRPCLPSPATCLLSFRNRI
jgi:hypothetical protein